MIYIIICLLQGPDSTTSNSSDDDDEEDSGVDSRTTCVTLDRLDIHQPQKQRGDKLDENKNPFVWPKPNQV